MGIVRRLGRERKGERFFVRRCSPSRLFRFSRIFICPIAGSLSLWALPTQPLPRHSLGVLLHLASRMEIRRKEAELSPPRSLEGPKPPSFFRPPPSEQRERERGGETSLSQFRSSCWP